MKTSWTKGLDKDAAKMVEDAYPASSVLRERLKELLLDKYTSCERSSLTKEGYNIPNWPLLKADETGYKRALQEIINLIS